MVTTRLKAAMVQNFLWSAILVVTAGCATSTPCAPPLLSLELDYWEQTSPLRHRAILEGGTPFAAVYLDNLSGLVEGDLQAWQDVADAAQMALPVYQSVLDEWLKIQPPGVGESGNVHTAYGRAWGERVASLVLIVSGWNRYTASADPLDGAVYQEGLRRIESAGEFGQEAESLQREFNTYLVSQCEKYRAATCKAVPE